MAIVDGFLFTLTFVTALGCGLIAGLFFAFSVAVMQALARLPSAGGIAAMQAMNSAILNPLFLSVFLGTGAGSALIIVTALLCWHSPRSAYLLVGGTLYLAGRLVLTHHRSHRLTPRVRVCGLVTLSVGQPGTMFGR